jgi:phosphohistidine phosphatase
MKDDETDGQARLVYLVRHGQAAPGAVDPARPLTEDGRQSVGRMAEWAVAAGVQVDLILHSGKLRAEQTAEILAQHLKPPRGVAATEGLRPNDALGYAHDLILTENGPLMLVGHLPHLGRLVAHLVAGDADRPLVEFDAAAFVSLVQREEGWCISCAIQPTWLK